MLQVVGQVAARQLHGAAVGARDNIEGAGGEVALRETPRRVRSLLQGRFWRRSTGFSHLQLLHLARPAAALLTVDAADGQRQDLLLQLWIRVDLKNKNKWMKSM